MSQTGFTRKSKNDDLNLNLLNNDKTSINSNNIDNQVPKFSRSDSYTTPNTNTNTNTNSIENRRGSLPQSDSLTSNPLKNKNDSIIKKVPTLNGWDIIIFMENNIENSNIETSLPTENDDLLMTPQRLYDRLIGGGLEVYCYKSRTEKHIIFKVRTPLDLLKEYAEESETSFLLDYKKLHLIDSKKHPICDNPHVSKIDRYKHLHAPYKQNQNHLFKHAEGCDHPFNANARIKVTIHIIEADLTLGKHACGLDMDTLVENNEIVAYFPCHDKSEASLLKKSWFVCSVQPWEQPIDDIKEYFGEKIALYFEFLGHYTTWLLALTIAGFIMELDIIIQSSTYKSYHLALIDCYLAPAFAVFVSFWSQFMLEYWKRKECLKAMEWGTSEFENVERERPDFHGENLPSVVNGKMAKFFPPAEFKKRQHYSNFIITLMILLVICCVAFIFFLQILISRSNNPNVQNFGSTFASVLNAVQIQVLNIIYEKVAVSLTRNENYRTDTAFEDALIAKLFSFQFVNSYASFYYLAFVKYNLHLKKNDSESSVMYELGLNLAIVFAIRLCVSKTQSFMTMYVNAGLKEKKDDEEFEEYKKQNPSKNYRLEKTKAEKEYNLEEYDSLMGTLSNYAEIAVQFGYVTLFVVAFPLAPFMAYVSNLVEFRSDGYQLLTMNRRVLPVGCQDIGTWMSIFQTMSAIAVITNLGIVCFTMQVFHCSLSMKVWIFIILQYFVFTSMGLFGYLIDDIPYEVQLQLQRQDYILERLENENYDKDEEEVTKRRRSLLITNRMIIHDDDTSL